MSRVIALCTSAVAALLFASAFATDSHLAYQLDRFFAGKEQNPSLVIYLGILAAIFIGYALATRQRFAKSGGALAALAVAAMYAWCSLRCNLSLQPVLLVIAGPALFHLLADVLQSSGPSQENLPIEQGPYGIMAATNEGEPTEREMAAGTV